MGFRWHHYVLFNLFSFHLKLLHAQVIFDDIMTINDYTLEETEQKELRQIFDDNHELVDEAKLKAIDVHGNWSVKKTSEIIQRS